MGKKYTFFQHKGSSHLHTINTFRQSQARVLPIVDTHNERISANSNQQVMTTLMTLLLLSAVVLPVAEARPVRQTTSQSNSDNYIKAISERSTVHPRMRCTDGINFGRVHYESFPRVRNYCDKPPVEVTSDFRPNNHVKDFKRYLSIFNESPSYNERTSIRIEEDECSYNPLSSRTRGSTDIIM